MKRLYFVFVLFLYYFQANAQLVFDKLPHELQLYPRDTSNRAVVVVSGKMDTPGYGKITMRVAREGVLSSVVSQTLDPSSSTFPFSLSATIKAEPAEYGVQVYIFKGADSLLVANPQHIVCGDVYIIHGQSNALALSDFDVLYSFNFNDKYIRNVAYPYMGSPLQMSWYPAKQPFASIGGFGLTLQRLILENYGIPTCVINGAMGGTAIEALSVRDPVNHANPITFYGDLLNRAQWAGVAKQTKAIIWKQGEEDAGSGLPGYPAKFATLYNQFREDYGNARIYVGQINILNNPEDSAAALRDFQRRTRYIFPNVEAIATVGTPGYDGVHYSGLAHQRLAYEQFRQIARDIYGSTDTLQINSPDVKKVFFNTRKDSITLVFDDQMQMVWIKDTTFYNFATGAKIAYREQKDFFYLDRQPGMVTAGVANGNRVILSLKQPTTAKTLRYLPAYFSDLASPFYDGPTLRNTRGMRAFSFDNVAIAEAIAPVTTLATNPVSEKRIQLNWTPSPTAEIQILERADGSSNTFQPIARLTGAISTFSDENIPDIFGTYFYRLRSFSRVSESVYSNIASARPLVLGTETAEVSVKIYPNPVGVDRMLYIESDKVMFTELTVRDVRGSVAKSWRGTARKAISLPLDNLDAGLYIAEIPTTAGSVIRRKLIVR